MFLALAHGEIPEDVAISTPISHAAEQNIKIAPSDLSTLDPQARSLANPSFRSTPGKYLGRTAVIMRGNDFGLRQLEGAFLAVSEVLADP